MMESACRSGRRIAIWGALVLLMPHGTAIAADVEPPYAYLEVTPGKVFAFPMLLRTQQPTEKVILRAVDFSIDRKGIITTQEPRDKRFSGKLWCRLPPTELILRKGTDTTLDIPFLVPAGTASGEYYLGIEVYSPGASTVVTEEGAKLRFDVNVVVMVVLRVAGGSPRYNAEVLDPVITVKDSLPVAQAVFHSLSSLALIARMGVTIRGEDKRVVDWFLLQGANSKAPDGQAFVLQDGYREFSGEGNRKLPAGKYVADVESRYGDDKKPMRTVKQVRFEVVGGSFELPPPIDDVVVTPASLTLEMPPGGVKYEVIEFKNRGWNPVRLSLSSDQGVVAFFPETVQIDPGKVARVRATFRLPPAQHPRRDLTLRIQVEGGGEKNRKTIPVAIYAPGTAPKDEKKPAFDNGPREERR